MKLLYLDCNSGISGDMILGSLLDSGLDIESLRKELAKLPLRDYSISAKKILRNGISSTKFNVEFKDNHPERHIKEIFGIIGKSKLDDKIKETSKRIFSK